jgi:hypothetical protein
MMRVFYGSCAGHAHRYQCKGDNDTNGTGLCVGIGGVRVDRAVASQLLEALSEQAIEAAIRASEKSVQADADVRQAIANELEAAQYAAALAERRYEAVDPTKRLVARELESRWNTALERVAELEQRIARLDHAMTSHPDIDREALLALAHDLPAVWNAPGTQPRTRQRLTAILVKEVVIDLDEASNEAVLLIHWVGGRHTEIRVARVRTGRYPEDRYPSPVEVIRRLGGQWPDRELAVTMNRMRCKSANGNSWTTVQVRELRERLGIAPFDPDAPREESISVDETAQRLGICVGSVHRLIREGVLPATQLMHSAPWQVPVAALDSEAVRAGVRAVKARRPSNFKSLQDVKTLRIPGF